MNLLYGKRLNGEQNKMLPKDKLKIKEYREKLSKVKKGKNLTEEHKRKIRISCKGINQGRKRPDLSRYNKKRKGKFKHLEITKQKIKNKLDIVWKDATLRNKQSKKLKEVFKTPTIRKQRSIRVLGKNNPAYVHGNSKYPYPIEFNRIFKDEIRIFYNFTCQLCGKEESELLGLFKKHVPHHINYIPNDLRDINFILLCHECNKKVNWNRDYWYAYFCYLKNISPEVLV